MKKILALLFSLTVVAGCSCPVIQPPPPPPPPAAATIYGHDFLGAGNAHMRPSVLIEGIDPGSAVGFFSDDWPGNFGNPYPTIRELAQSGKVVLLRGQCYWSYQHRPAPVDNVRNCADKLERLALDFPSIKVVGSPSCEYDNTASIGLVRNWAKAFKNRAPHVQMVLTPMNGLTIPGYTIEKHGDKVRGAAALSTDGNNIFDANAAKLVKENNTAQYLLGWGMRYNLSESGDNPPAPDRTAAPTVQYIRSIGALYKPRTGGNLNYPQLYKSHAEDKPGEDDRRANRPLLILKQKAPFVEILDINNRVLGKFPYYNSYLDQGHRYYSGSPNGIGLYGYEIGDLARSNSGSDVIKVRISGTIYTIGSAAFRTPYYQE